MISPSVWPDKKKSTLETESSRNLRPGCRHSCVSETDEIRQRQSAEINIAVDYE
jgi:hypothetical protein